MLGVDGVGDRRCQAILARNFSVENWERQEERKRSKKRKKRVCDPNSRARPPRSGDCDSAWTSSLRKGGAEVDYQVAAPTESSTPNLHRATIAQQRVRMEGWRQRRLGSTAKISTREEKKNRLDTHRPSHGRHWRVRWQPICCIFRFGDHSPEAPLSHAPCQGGENFHLLTC